MATIEKGMRQGFKDMRCAITADFEQGGDLTGRNLLIVVANDRVSDTEEMTPENAVVNPPLVRRDGVKKDGEKFTSYTLGVSEKQYESIMAVANTDGDKPVFNADLMIARDHSNDGKVIGLMPNTNKLGKKPEVPFDYEKHKENTTLGREYRKAQRDAEAQDKQTETEANVEKEPALEP